MVKNFSLEPAIGFPFEEDTVAIFLSIRRAESQLIFS